MRGSDRLRLLANWRTLTLSVLVTGVGTGAFFLGRSGGLSEAVARSPVQAAIPDPPPQNTAAQPLPLPPGMSNAYTRNAVAYMYGTVPITREEFGEYLIARYGAGRLEPFVNKRIIEYHCQKEGIAVNQAEIEMDLKETIDNLKVDQRTFETQVLKGRGKTLYDWKEDVIRPKLLMAKLCRERVKAEEEDIRKGYDAYYGEKVKVQMIYWPLKEKNVADKMWGLIHKDEKAFDKAAREQASVELARVGGMVAPFGRNTTATPKLEELAFDKLEIGDVSPILETPQGYVVMKLLARIPPEKDVSLEKVRDKLVKEILDKKAQLEFPVVFNEIKTQADLRILLKKFETQEQLEREVRKEVNDSKTPVRLPEPERNPLPFVPNK